MVLIQNYLKDVITDSLDINKNESRSCKYCQYNGTTLAERKGIDYCYGCHFHKKNVNFKLRNEIYLALDEIINNFNVNTQISKRKIKLLDGEIQSFWFKGESNPCKCGSNLFHEEFDGVHLYGVCNACNIDVYEMKYNDDYIKNSKWKDKED